MKSLKNKLTVLGTSAVLLASQLTTTFAVDTDVELINEGKFQTGVVNPVLNMVFIISRNVALIVMAAGLIYVCFTHFSSDREEGTSKFVLKLFGVICVGLVLLYLENIVGIFYQG